MTQYNERLLHLLWEVFVRTSALGEAAIHATSLSRPGLGMLDITGANPGITVSEIARRLPVTQQSVSQIVARLEGLGLLERRLLGGRNIGLYLTETGARMRAAGDAADVAFERELEVALGPARYERFRKILLEAKEVVEDLGAKKDQPAESAYVRCRAAPPRSDSRPRRAKRKAPRG